ncbi:MAG: pirin family protein [Bacteroidia bacterium]
MHASVREDIQGLVTYNVIPTQKVAMDKLDPFLFLNHHGPQVFSANNKGLPFGAHPHKGFETVTFILDGDIAHKDNSGHSSIIKAGGIQWMTAGKGIIHSEVSSNEFMKNGGNVEILQLWINLPAKLKNAEPKYIGLEKDQIPELTFDDGKVKVNLIGGQWGEEEAPFQSLTDVLMTTIEIESEGSIRLPVDNSREVFFYVVSGAVRVNEQDVEKRTLIEFDREGDHIFLQGIKKAVVLFGTATPTNEPVVAKGPFVMNTQEEIIQAYKDYREGKFGSPME